MVLLFNYIFYFIYLFVYLLFVRLVVRSTSRSEKRFRSECIGVAPCERMVPYFLATIYNSGVDILNKKHLDESISKMGPPSDYSKKNLPYILNSKVYNII